MSANSEPLMKLDGVRKVFYTDEVETHALSGIHLDIKKGEYISIAGPSGCGKSTLLSHTRPARLADRGRVHAQRHARRRPVALRTRAHTQPRDRLHLPGVQSHRRPHGLRERRAAAHLPRHDVRGARGARGRGAREGRHVAPNEALPRAALGRSAAARRGRARGRRQRPRYCSPTSRRATSTPRTARPS